MNWDVVKQLVAYARSVEKEHNKNFRFTLTTNGMLIDDDVIDFANRECVNVVLSLDGRKEVHDRYRVDYAGFSTYESVYRAKEIFGAKKILIVTQEYHLYRALHVAEALGVEAYGVSADLHSYWGQSQRDLREVAARCKDVLYGIFRPEPTYLGQPISLTGDGDLTNDENSDFT